MGRFSWNLSKESQMKVRSMKYFLLNREAPRPRNLFTYPNGFKCLITFNKMYVEYLYGVLCHVTLINLNQHSDLVIMNDCSSVGTFSTR